MMIKPNSDCGIHHPGPAPIEYVGQWVAWNKELTEIVAHGVTISEVRTSAITAGHRNAIYQKVPRPGAFIGPASMR